MRTMTVSPTSSTYTSRIFARRSAKKSSRHGAARGTFSMYKPFRSLRWRLQSWHALILIASVVGFGSVLFWEMVRGHWDRIDEELLSAARILEGSLRGERRPILESMAQDILHPPGPATHVPGRPHPPPPRRSNSG